MVSQECIFGDYLSENKDFQELLEQNAYDSQKILGELLSGEWPVHDLFEKYKMIYSYFDDWVRREAREEYYRMERYRKHQQEVAIKNSEELEVKLKERVSSLQEIKDELQEAEEILKTMGDSYSERYGHSMYNF